MSTDTTDPKHFPRHAPLVQQLTKGSGPVIQGFAGDATRDCNVGDIFIVHPGMVFEPQKSIRYSFDPSGDKDRPGREGSRYVIPNNRYLFHLTAVTGGGEVEITSTASQVWPIYLAPVITVDPTTDDRNVYTVDGVINIPIKFNSTKFSVESNDVPQEVRYRWYIRSTIPGSIKYPISKKYGGKEAQCSIAAIEIVNDGIDPDADFIFPDVSGGFPIPEGVCEIWCVVLDNYNGSNASAKVKVFGMDNMFQVLSGASPDMHSGLEASGIHKHGFSKSGLFAEEKGYQTQAFGSLSEADNSVINKSHYVDSSDTKYVIGQFSLSSDSAPLYGQIDLQNYSRAMTLTNDENQPIPHPWPGSKVMRYMQLASASQEDPIGGKKYRIMAISRSLTYDLGEQLISTNGADVFGVEALPGGTWKSVDGADNTNSTRMKSDDYIKEQYFSNSVYSDFNELLFAARSSLTAKYAESVGQPTGAGVIAFVPDDYTLRRSIVKFDSNNGDPEHDVCISNDFGCDNPVTGAHLYIDFSADNSNFGPGGSGIYLTTQPDMMVNCVANSAGDPCIQFEKRFEFINTDLDHRFLFKPELEGLTGVGTNDGPIIAAAFVEWFYTIQPYDGYNDVNPYVSTSLPGRVMFNDSTLNSASRWLSMEFAQSGIEESTPQDNPQGTPIPTKKPKGKHRR